MGNRPLSGDLLGNSDHYCVINIGKRASIVFSGREVGKDRGGEKKESWSMVYNAGTSLCTLTLSKTLGKHNAMMMIPSQHDEKLVIEINDLSNGIYNFFLNLQRDEAGLLHQTSEMEIVASHSNVDCFNSCTADAYGEITQTQIHIYGIGKRRGLVVTEWKKKGKDQNPYSGSMAHYFVSNEKGVDVGLSVAIRRIRVLPNNGAIDFVVNGPENHPAHALDYMFRQVQRTKSWKPTDCPHCADKYILLQRQSEFDRDADNAPPPPFQGRGPSTGAFASNPGSFMGENMCNVNINNLMLCKRKWP